MGRISEITSKQAVGRTVERATADLPASATGHLFKVTGDIIVTNIVGEVTTIVQTQACNAKLTATPTVGAAVDMCADLNITASAVNANLSITGTLANALVKTTGGAHVPQAAKLLVHDGYIDLITSATNTGKVKWTIQYIPVGLDSLVEAV